MTYGLETGALSHRQKAEWEVEDDEDAENFKESDQNGQD